MEFYLLIESECRHQNILSSTNAYVCNVSRFGREMNVSDLYIQNEKEDSNQSSTVCLSVQKFQSGALGIRPTSLGCNRARVFWYRGTETT